MDGWMDGWMLQTSPCLFARMMMISSSSVLVDKRGILALPPQKVEPTANTARHGLQDNGPAVAQHSSRQKSVRV